MSSANPELPRDLADRIVRDLFLRPQHLRGLLARVVPVLAGGFDCERAVPGNRETLLSDWRRREADLVFLIPYRISATEERTALVWVLIEHQSDTDPRMPLRMLHSVVSYWEKQWKEWEEKEPPRPTFRLTPVLPIVVHTGLRPWGSNRTLVDLLDEPEAFHAFAPRWEPLFWNLADLAPEAMLASAESWLQMLSVMRVDGADRDRYLAVHAEAMRRLEALYPHDHGLWYDLVHVVMSWGRKRRPREESQDLLESALASQRQATSQKEEIQSRKLNGKAIM